MPPFTRRGRARRPARCDSGALCLEGANGHAAASGGSPAQSRQSVFTSINLRNYLIVKQYLSAGERIDEETFFYGPATRAEEATGLLPSCVRGHHRVRELDDSVIEHVR